MSRGTGAAGPMILAIRHGATELSASGAFVGRTDPPLSARGETQAMAWGGFAASGLVTRTATSPLRRAAQTAALAGFPAPTVDADLAEWDLGELEGRDAETWRRANPGWSLFDQGPPGEAGERYADVAQRVGRVISGVTSEEGLTVLVAHGQLLKVLAVELLGLPVANASRLAYGPGRAALYLRRSAGWCLAGWNLAAPGDPGNFVAELT